ncbi:MAG: GFA family protein [Gammaproteobacteria bacterium]|nr:GFA family protein [Gammaproteobacteria bacterium]
MKLDGSCHCGAVNFTLQSSYPYPFNLCYCSICRKTAGSGGFAINLGGDYNSLVVMGQEHITVYQAIIDDEQSPTQRSFCRHCATALWVWDPRWPELIHPFASAIDTELPKPPEHTHLMLASKAEWVEPCLCENDKQFEVYPEESIAAWHDRLDLRRE